MKNVEDIMLHGMHEGAIPQIEWRPNLLTKIILNTKYNNFKIYIQQ